MKGQWMDGFFASSPKSGRHRGVQRRPAFFCLRRTGDNSERGRFIYWWEERTLANGNNL